MTLYLYSNFNNYYNRRLKRFATVSEYGTPVHTLNAANFNPRDGVNTTHTFNYDGADPDYCLAVDADGVIVSRWYVLESHYNNGSQYVMTLYRDAVADNWAIVKDAPCFVEKGTVAASNPLIFNDESITFNQIKTSEHILADTSGCPWIVGYLTHRSEDDEITVPIDDINPDITVTDITNWEYYQYRTTPFKQFPYSYGYRAIMDIKAPGTEPTQILDFKEDRYIGATSDAGAYYTELSGAYADRNIIGRFIGARVSAWTTDMLNAIGAHTKNESASLKRLTGKTIYDAATGTYYAINIKQGTRHAGETYEVPLNTALDADFKSVIEACPQAELISAGATGLSVQYSYVELYVELTEIPASSFTITFNAACAHVDDAPYDIFTFPAGNFAGDDQFTIQMSYKKALRMAAAIDRHFATEVLLDLQILPYCPIPEKIHGFGGLQHFDEDDFASNEYMKSDGEAFVVFLTKSQMTNHISYNINVTDPKIESQTDVYRITAPNYGSVFEFNAAKNGGVDGFRVDCSFKPYTPYVHVAPNFGRMYGEDFGDARGLVCGGDFSLPRTSEAWQEYELRNKNYEKIFDRQIENMNVNNAIATTQATWQAVTGAVAGTATGAAAGGMIGGVWGVVGGGAAGGIASGVGGIADVSLLKQQQMEQMDYTHDMYGYNLGNIKALPTTITKVSAINPNNKLIPVLEFYTCTDEERTALVNKIRYNGMTVMVIGKLSDYCTEGNDEYVKGQLIRLDGLVDDFHTAVTIAEEINKGVFV